MSARLIEMVAAPDDHFTATPHCRVTLSCRGRVASPRGYPTVRAGIVSRAGVKIVGAAGSSAPDDHFTASPDRRVVGSASGRVGDAGGCPAIVCAWRIPFGNSWKSVDAVCYSRCRRHASQIFAAGGFEAPFVVRR